MFGLPSPDAYESPKPMISQSWILTSFATEAVAPEPATTVSSTRYLPSRGKRSVVLQAVDSAAGRPSMDHRYLTIVPAEEQALTSAGHPAAATLPNARSGLRIRMLALVW